jgi:ribonuclease Z
MSHARLLAMILLGATIGSQTTLAQNSNLKPTATAAPLTVTILGSGGGPPVDLQRFGPSIFVQASNGDKLLFDCGRGFAQRLTEYGISLAAVDKLFLTHLHSDHILSIPDLLLVGWTSGRKTPLQVWGPTGTKNMMDYLGKAFEFDIKVRSDFDDRLPLEAVRTVTKEIDEGVIYENNGVKVTAFVVDHGPTKPAFDYRVDYAGHSVAMSGDTRFSENLIQHSRGVDLLIHESSGAGRVAAPNPGETERERIQREKVAAIHTSAAETAVVFNRVKPRLAVYAHGGGPLTVAEARKTYVGPLEDGEDLMTIEIGDRVEVRRHDKIVRVARTNP